VDIPARIGVDRTVLNARLLAATAAVRAFLRRQQDQGVRMIAHRRRRAIIVDVAVICLVAGVLTAAVGARALGLHLQTVTSGSMAPAVGAGDVALTAPVLVADLQAGDVIAFYPPDRDAPVLHRIVTVTTTDQGVAITTRGDANGADDPWRAVLRGDTAYRLVGVVPLVGWLTAFRGPMLVVAGLLLAIVLLREIRKEYRGHRPSLS
jgi:signal peptidase I